ncbi:spermidine synthase [Agromyces sp. MMS24-JH15]|uniref:spermidine synthase n=1 Tax=Agromyces sp. MMS24-JH15 TaxID=3243765 RepID=UPI003749B425
MGRIEFEADIFSPTGMTLIVDGTAQSHVDRGDPTRLFFEYTRRIGHVIDALGTPGAPIRATHLGGGGLTLPRYVDATRPGSSQVVVEHDERLLRLVLERLPLPRGADIETVVADARDAIVDLAAGAGRGASDLVVLDLYTRLDPPAFTTDPAFLADALALLAPDGVLVANVADGAGLVRLGALARAVARADPRATLVATGDANVIAGSEDGNTVLVVAPGGMPERIVPRLRERGPHPAEVLEGARLDHVLWGAC